MANATDRVKQVVQPKGGYVPIKLVKELRIKDDTPLISRENIKPWIVGLAVDYLTRLMLGTDKNEVFKMSITGSYNFLELYHYSDPARHGTSFYNIRRFYSNIRKENYLSDISIYCTCNLVSYDVCYREVPYWFNGTEVRPDKQTINNIRQMVLRSLDFLKIFGPVVKHGFHFGGGYTETIDKAEGDYLTKDTLWDFKVLNTFPNNANRLQVLVYYLMGKESNREEFKSINKLGIYNPRFNAVYLINTLDINEDTMEDVKKNVIGYEG